MSFYVSLSPILSLQKHFANLQQLDKANDDIASHIEQIFDKFAAIIRERLQAHLGSPEAYSAALLEQSTQSLECSLQMSRFLKEFGSLHRVLSQYLSPEQMIVCFHSFPHKTSHFCFFLLTDICVFCIIERVHKSVSVHRRSVCANSRTNGCNKRIPCAHA